MASQKKFRMIDAILAVICVVFVAEAFSPMSISEDLTPTLYKMYNEGFQFTNFYTPVYYVSTSDGEYVSLTSLLPKDGTWSMSTSSKNYLPFVHIK